ncbi:Rv0361 family membrane protein [Mycolicibacterium confluentis]|uniref:Uncharacterized protein n=1 Tax=Mycolicibacterium confluentis TaxID=28047 RepID=A0A7I7Y4Z6_9MYCO|nr:hypothetical protein [Mycolicibacterium confluentis]MCV7318094.1 nuclear transport factor 2 family protein [Mycolicibacterium confluentis]ORV31190.1 hypothetical protein AWB99_12280 [Mycolicibacterium confluentis]BBZ36001.1 hypothetical protein MCNF_46060 [Mycolicibacterium confluentis]
MLRARDFAVTLMVGAVVLAGCSRQVAPDPVLAPETTTMTAPDESPSAAAPSTADAPSDADLINKAVMDFQDAYNTKKWDTYLSLMCTAMRDQFVGPVIDTLKTTRDAQGLTNVAVTDVQIDGDTGIATLDAQNEMLGRRTIELRVAREDGWKVCMPY